MKCSVGLVSRDRDAGLGWFTRLRILQHYCLWQFIKRLRPLNVWQQLRTISFFAKKHRDFLSVCCFSTDPCCKGISFEGPILYDRRATIPVRKFGHNLRHQATTCKTLAWHRWKYSVLWKHYDLYTHHGDENICIGWKRFKFERIHILHVHPPTRVYGRLGGKTA